MPKGYLYDPDSDRDRHCVNAYIGSKLFRFFTQRRYAERLTVQRIMSAAVVAYVLGDLEVTQEGYRVPAARPTEEPVTVIETEDGNEEVFTLEDANLRREIVEEWKRANKIIEPKREGDVRLGSRWLQGYLEDRLQRKISRQGLLKFLRTHFPDVREDKYQEWSFTGPDDPLVVRIETRMRRFPLTTLTDHDRKMLGIGTADDKAARTDEQLLSDQQLLEDHVSQ